jgi:hypothetical protein
VLDVARVAAVAFIVTLVVLVTRDGCDQLKVASPPLVPLHYRTICPASGDCVRVGIPSGECTTVSGITLCVGPDAGVVSPTPERNP